MQLLKPVLFVNVLLSILTLLNKINYRTRAIISRGLYIFYPIFKDHFFVFKEVFSENSVLMYGLYSRAACNQERLMMARVRYVVSFSKQTKNLERYLTTERICPKTSSTKHKRKNLKMHSYFYFQSVDIKNHDQISRGSTTS